MLWWFRMLNISARKSKDMRSVSANDLPNAKSAFHAPGPRKAFLAVMFAGNGPKVSMHPSHAGLHVESAPGRHDGKERLPRTRCMECGLCIGQIVRTDGT